jgi:hypothetical protein
LACCVVDTNVKKEANYELHKNLSCNPGKGSCLCGALRMKALFEKVENSLLFMQRMSLFGLGIGKLAPGRRG